MAWYEDLLAWLEEPEPSFPGSARAEWRRASERIAAVQLAKRGRPITPEAVAAETARWPTGERLAEASAPSGLTDEEATEVARRDRERREERPEPHGAPEPPWSRGASAEEIRAFGLSECLCGSCPIDNRPDGSSIPLMATGSIRELLAIADRRLDRCPTRWLEGYATQLIAEFRRRRGGR